MDEAELAAAIEALIEGVEVAHPDYELQVLVEAVESSAAVRMEAMVIERQTELVTRFVEEGADPAIVFAQVSQAVRTHLSGPEPGADAESSHVDE